MRVLIILFLAAFALTSCKSWEISKVSPEEEAINPKLITLKKEIGGRFFVKELEQNLMDPYGAKYGSIQYRTEELAENRGVFFTVLSGLSFGTLNLLGFPLMIFEKEMEAEVRIFDKNDNLVGKYTATGKGKATAAMYYGYNPQNAFDKAELDALREAHKVIRTEIQEEVKRLNEKLRETGKL